MRSLGLRVPNYRQDRERRCDSGGDDPADLGGTFQFASSRIFRTVFSTIPRGISCLPRSGCAYQLGRLAKIGAGAGSGDFATGFPSDHRRPGKCGLTGSCI